jgi:cobalt-zinc-cadmium efflux system outer membrane protein
MPLRHRSTFPAGIGGTAPLRRRVPAAMPPLSALLLFAIAFTSVRLYAQESAVPSRLTLEQAIRLAVARNPALEAYRNGVEALQGASVTARQRLNPAVTLEQEDFPLRTHPGPFFGTQELTLRFDYEVETGGRRQLRTKAAEQAVEAQKLAYRDQVRRIELEVERAFARMVLAKSNLETSRSVLEQAERMIDLNRVRFKQGDISALDLNRIEVEKLRFQDDVFQADLMLRNSRSTLLALLNAPDLSQEVDVAGALPVGDAEAGMPPQAPLAELFRLAFERRPDIAAARQEDSRAGTETRLQRAMRSPNVTVGGGYKRSGPDNSYVFGITVPLQVFNRNEGEILRADAERKRSASLEAALEKQIQLEVQQAYNAVEINRQRVEYIKSQHLKRAEEASTVTLTSYNLGGATLIDYLDAQRTYRDALRTYNQALFDERVSLYELASAVGSTVTGSGVE